MWPYTGGFGKTQHDGEHGAAQNSAEIGNDEEGLAKAEGIFSRRQDHASDSARGLLSKESRMGLANG